MTRVARPVGGETMSEKVLNAPPPPPWRDMPYYGHDKFQENRSNKTLEDLLPYAGEVVFWLPDGSGVRAHGPDAEALFKMFDELGESYSWYIMEQIPLRPGEGQI